MFYFRPEGDCATNFRFRWVICEVSIDNKCSKVHIAVAGLVIY